MRALDWLRRLLSGRRGGPATLPVDAGRRLRLLPSTLRELRARLAFAPERPEPLALLVVRYASEGNRSVIVGVRVDAFPDDAYVDGPDGANFSVSCLMEALDRLAEINAGVLLCHMHGHAGKPRFSATDVRTNEEVMAKQRVFGPLFPYGALVVSDDDATAVVASSDDLLEFAVAPVISCEAGERP